MKFNKFSRWLGAAAIVSGLASAAAAQDNDPIKVGFVLTLSGPGAALGEDMRRGADLALKMLGGKFGDRDVQYVYEDDKLQPEVGREEAMKLVQSEKVDVVIGSSYSNVMMAIARPITRSKTFLLSPNPAPAPLAGSDCSPYYFATPFQNDEPAEAMGIYLNEKGVKSAFILAPNYQAGRDLLAGFKRNFKGEIVGELYTPLEQTDFSPELTQIRAANPEAVFIFYPGGLGVQFVRQYAQAGLKETIPLTTAFVVGGSTLPAIGDAGLGVVAASHWAYNLDNPANQEFVAAYQKEYGNIPSEFAAQAYDAVRLYASAVTALDGRIDDKEAVRAALAAAKYDSIRGPFTFNTNQHPVQDMRLLVVEKDDSGQPVAVAKSVIVKDMKDSYAPQCSME